jgi:hypothetical protein
MKKYKHLEVAIYSRDILDDEELNPVSSNDSSYLIKVGMIRMQNEVPTGHTEETIKQLAEEAVTEYIKMLKHNGVI